MVQVSRGLPPDDSQASAGTDRDQLAAASASARAAQSQDRAGLQLGSPKISDEERGGGRIVTPRIDGGAGGPPVINRGVYTGVDFKGGDIHGVGPLEAATAMVSSVAD